MEKSYSYTPDIVSRSIKQKGNGVIEVVRYNFGHMKANGAWPWFLCVTLITLYNIFIEPNIVDDIKWAFSVDWALENSWKQHLFFTKSNSVSTYEDFKKEMMQMHSSTLYFGLFFLLFPILIFLWLASPKWRPLRIDSKRRLIYFWSWGRFYIMQYPAHLKAEPSKLLWLLHTRMFNSWMHREAMGSLVFQLPYENPAVKKKRSVPVGLYRPVYDYQNYALRDFILDYICSDDGDKEYAAYFQKEKRIWRDYFNWFYQFSLFPAMGYNEKKTEEKIQAWLAKYGE